MEKRKINFKEYERLNTEVILPASRGDKNKVLLLGIVEEKFSHFFTDNSTKTEFVRSNLKVKRTSGAVDSIIIALPKNVYQLYKNNFSIGSRMFIKGEMRSIEGYDIKNNKHLVQYVLINEIQLADDDEEDTNIVLLEGYICKPVNYRVNTSTIANMLIAVNYGNHKKAYVSCIAWNKLANIVKEFKVGKKVYFSGRIKRNKVGKHEIDIFKLIN